jgi:predicted translin family RNA/ssDNA-binding protein
MPLRKKRLPKRISQAQVKAQTIKDLDVLLEELGAKEVDQAAVKFFELVHKFFSSFCRMRYQFTYDELLRDLKRRKLFDEFLRKKLMDFIQRLQEKEYSGTEFSRNELRQYVAEFKLFVKSSTGPDTLGTSINIKPLAKARLWMHGVKHKFGKNDVTKIVELIHATENSLPDIEKAQSVYSNIMNLYNRLSSEEQESVRSTLGSVYNKIADNYANGVLKELEEQQRQFYKALEKGDNDTAIQMYNTVHDLYENLPEKNRKRVYLELKNMHKELQENLVRARMTDIKRLLKSVKDKVTQEQVSGAQENYSKAQILYDKLPEPRQKKLFTQMQVAYKLVSQS